MLVAGAGPVSNLLLALLFTAALFVAVRMLPGPLQEQPLAELLIIGIQLNVSLALFNLVPIPPLDGSQGRILGAAERARAPLRSRRWGRTAG